MFNDTMMTVPHKTVH